MQRLNCPAFFKKNHVTVLHFEFTFVSCRLSDAEGSMKFSPEKKGKVSMGDFDSKVRHIKLFTYKDSSTLWQER